MIFRSTLHNKEEKKKKQNQNQNQIKSNPPKVPNKIYQLHTLLLLIITTS